VVVMSSRLNLDITVTPAVQQKLGDKYEKNISINCNLCSITYCILYFTLLNYFLNNT
jgi:hypothetical protein